MHAGRFVPQLFLDFLTITLLSVTTWQTFSLRQLVSDQSLESAFVEDVWLSVLGHWIVVVGVTLGTWPNVLPLHVPMVSSFGWFDRELSAPSQATVKLQNW